MDAQTVETRRNGVIEDSVARTGIDAAMIEVLVRAFYARVRLDPLIGPVFEPTPSGKPLP